MRSCKGLCLHGFSLVQKGKNLAVQKLQHQVASQSTQSQPHKEFEFTPPVVFQLALECTEEVGGKPELNRLPQLIQIIKEGFEGESENAQTSDD